MTLSTNTRETTIASGEEARTLYAEYGFNDNVQHLVQFISSLNISLILKPMQDHTSGYLKRINDLWEMGINSLHHPRRQRFIMAHELGHYFLHSGSKRNFEDQYLFKRDNNSDPIEWEANQFAAEFLMPRREFIKKMQSGITAIDKLAIEFQVSTMAVRIRAKKLGIKGHGLND